jgi:hypothetical protein
LTTTNSNVVVTDTFGATLDAGRWMVLVPYMV